MGTTLALLPAPPEALTFTTYVPVAAELLEPPELLPQPAAYRPRTRIAVSPSRGFKCFRRMNGNSSPAKASVEVAPHRGPTVELLAVTGCVFTVTFTLPGFRPSSVTEAGAMLQLIPGGKFPQDTCTVCVEPPSGMMLMVAVPLCPDGMAKFAGCACIV